MDGQVKRQTMKYFVIFVLLVLIIAVLYSSGQFVASVRLTTDSEALQQAWADYATQQAHRQESNSYSMAANVEAPAQSTDSIGLVVMAPAKALDMARLESVMIADAQKFSSAQAMLLAQQQDHASASASAMEDNSVTAELAVSASKRQRDQILYLIQIIAAIVALVFGAKSIGKMIDAINERRGLENQRLTFGSGFASQPVRVSIEAPDVSQLGMQDGPWLELNSDSDGIEVNLTRRVM